jgi:hypothetical protein
MTQGAVMNEGVMSTRLGLRGWPNAAEDMIVARNVILSEYTGAHIHLQHISSRFSVDVIRRAKQRGARITAEATPHHIALTDDALATYDTNFKMNPPLRTEADRRDPYRWTARRHARHHRNGSRAAHGLREGQGVRLCPQRHPRPRNRAARHARCLDSSEQVQAPLRDRFDDAPPCRRHESGGWDAYRRRRGRHLHFRSPGEVALRRQVRLQQIEQLTLVWPDADRPGEDNDRRRKSGVRSGQDRRILIREVEPDVPIGLCAPLNPAR